jgi:transposase-like protein
VGTLNLKIPRFRGASFFPDDILERYQRMDRALIAAVAEMYAMGTSTRKVQRIAERMGTRQALGGPGEQHKPKASMPMSRSYWNVP